MKELRKRTGLTQKAFSEKYNIPLQTIKQWESNVNSSSYRKPPEYVKHLLARLVAIDFPANVNVKEPASNDPLVMGARDSAGNMKLWFRYLRKEFENGKCRITEDRLESLLNSSALTNTQKVVLKFATKEGSPTNLYVASLNQPMKSNLLEELRRKYGNDSQRI